MASKKRISTSSYDLPSNAMERLISLETQIESLDVRTNRVEGSLVDVLKKIDDLPEKVRASLAEGLTFRVDNKLDCQRLTIEREIDNKIRDAVKEHIENCPGKSIPSKSGDNKKYDITAKVLFGVASVLGAVAAILGILPSLLK